MEKQGVEGVIKQNMGVEHDDSRRSIINVFNAVPEDLENFVAADVKVALVPGRSRLIAPTQEQDELFYFFEGTAYFKIFRRQNPAEAKYRLDAGDRIVFPKGFAYIGGATEDSIVVACSKHMNSTAGKPLGLTYRNLEPDMDRNKAVFPLFDKISGFYARHVKVVKMNSDSEIGGYYHNYCEMLFMVRGEAKATVQHILGTGKRKYDLVPGDELLIPKGYAHKVEAKAGTVMVSCTSSPYSSKEKNSHEPEFQL
jgi:mannose-6-phosphate isomerase-like protein (cupin superfamily)